MPNSIFSAENVLTADIQGLAEAQRLLTVAQNAVDPRGGLRSSLTLAAGAVHRYVLSLGQDHPPLGQVGVLPMWSGRLKNSLFWTVGSEGGQLVGRVTSNLAYGPPVEERRGFMAKAAKDMAGPVNEIISADISAKIERGSA